jgi:hypothetical protein
MKRLYVMLVTVFTFLVVSAGNAASTDDQGAMDSPSPSTKGKHMPEMMGGMHGTGMMHQGTKGHHMMHSGMSPITFVVYPGMMPMMQHNMMHGNAEGGHGGGGMGQQDMMQRQNMMKKHMERMEQQLANIETLLGELVELQKANQ